MFFFNQRLEKVYKYLKFHSGETILIKDIAKHTGLTRQTAAKYVKWLKDRELIKKEGKHIELIPI